MEIENELYNMLDNLLKTKNAPISAYQNMIKKNPLINGQYSYCAIEKRIMNI